MDISEDSQYSKQDDPEDYLVMTIFSDKEGLKPLAHLDFTSSYGFFDLSVVDVTGDGQGEFFLNTGEGRGTSARSETLSVYKRFGSSFQLILHTPISDYFGVDRWWYKPIFADVNGDGVTDLILRLHHDDYRGHSIDDPSLIPKTKTKEFVFDKSKDRMVTYKSQK